MITKETLFAVTCSVLAFGCGTGQTPAEERQEIIDNLVEAGFQTDDITVADGNVYLGGDIHVTLEASRERVEPAGPGPEHYRSTSIVSGKTKICLVPSAAFSANATLMSGLAMARDNYNALPLVFDFLIGGTGCQASISITTTSGAGGSAGFPSGGNPYPGPVYIGTGTTAYGVDMVEHVITHEIGHTIGLCHTNGGGSGVGCILILGTPSMDASSVFNATPPAVTTGELSSGDIAALNILY